MASILSLLISIRFSRGGYRGGIASLLSVISIIGIALGVSVLIVILSVMNGFERELNNRILGIIPHGEIESVNQPWKNWSQALKKIEKIHGISSAAPYIDFTGLIESRSSLCAIQVKGIDPHQEERMNVLLPFIQNGTWSDFVAGKQKIILGKGVADTLKVKNGDWISMMISSFYPNHKLQQPKNMHLQIAGILKLRSQLDHNFAIVPLEDARTYLNMDDSVTGIAIKVNDVFNANKLACEAGKMTDSYVHIKSWISIYGYIYRDIQMIRTIIYFVMILVISVACFNIVSTLVIAVKNKIVDIAILRTLGARDNLVYAIFIWYGLLTGFTGSFYGIVIGIAVSLQLTPIIHSIEQLINTKFLSDDIYFIEFLPSELHYLDIIYVLATALILSMAASCYPARRAIFIDPSKILK